MHFMAKVQLAEAREAHQKALATTMALDEEIELNELVHYQEAILAPMSLPRVRTNGGGGPKVQSRRQCKALPDDSPAQSPAHSPL